MYGLLTIVLTVLYATVVNYRKRRAYPHPPGPPADPFIGHLRKLPTEQVEEKFQEWGRIYGDVMRIWLPGINMIVLNSEKAAMDLLHRRSSKFSSRQMFQAFNLMGWGDTTSELPYGKRLIAHRKHLNQYLYRKETESYYPFQVVQARKILQMLLNTPESYKDIFAFFSASIIVKITYGWEIQSIEDPIVRLAQAAGETVHHSGATGTTALDYFPILKHFPSWFPGTYYANYARQNAETVKRFHDIPYDDVQSQLKSGRAEPSFLALHIQKMEEQGLDDADNIRDLKALVANLFFAGADTTSSTLEILLLMLVLNPSVLQKAQKEIDKVIGTARLPDFQDREHLPYVECIVQETLRWHPVLPGGIPHLATDDDVYEGMYIPKGSIMFANVRGITMDERVYRNTHIFHPERFLPEPQGYGEPQPTGVFGYGRRICPGRYLGLNNVWIVAASIMAAFDISRAVGANGDAIDPIEAYSVGIIQVPKRFQFQLKARSCRAQELIEVA